MNYINEVAQGFAAYKAIWVPLIAWFIAQAGEIHHAHTGGLGLLAGIGDLFGVHGAEVHQQFSR